MRRILSAVIAIALVAAVFVSARPFSANADVTRVELAEKISDARNAYFSGGTEQTRKYLYGKLTAAESVISKPDVSSSEIALSYKELKKAIEGFRPIIIKGRAEINGIERWSDADIASMTTKGLSAELTDSVKAQGAECSLKLTLSGDRGEFFNSPGKDGAASPFATDMNSADGIAFWVSAKEYSKVSSLEFFVGKKTAEKEELLSVYDIPVTQEGYVYIPWEVFYPEYSALDSLLDLSGGMNRIGFIVNGVKGAEVYISDIHAFVETVEPDASVYEEVRVERFEDLKNNGLYKLVYSENGKVVTFGPEHTETQYRSETRIAHVEDGQFFSLEENAGNSVTQQWQIYKLAKSGKYHIINQGTSAAMTKSLSELTMQMNLDLDNEEQKWEVSENDGKFSFRIQERYLGISDGAPALVSESFSEWLVYECVSDAWVEVWSDEFNGEEIDRTKWNVANSKVRGDTEPTTFRDDPNNVYLEDGNLVIRTVVEEYDGYHATSGYMDTKGLFATTYGKFEMRAKLTYGSRVWPAFWMMGTEGNWPYNGEIDIMEFDGDGGAGEYEHSIYATNHWFYYNRFIHAAKGITLKNEEDEPFSARYHTFAVEWDENQIRTYVDDMLYMSMMLPTDELRWSFGDNPHYFILNTSMKGPGDNQLYEDTVDEAFFHIDYVRCYKRSSEVAEVPTYNDVVIDYKHSVGADNWMTDIEASPDGNQVISANRTGFFVIDATDDTVEDYVFFSGAEICGIEYSNDGEMFAVAERTGKIVVYDRYSIEEIATFSVPTLYISDMAFSADKKYIYFGGALNAEAVTEPTEINYSNSIYRGNIETSVTDISLDIGSNVREMDLSPDGASLLAGCSNGKVFLFDVREGMVQAECYELHTHCVRGVSWAPDGKTFATSDEDGRIYIHASDQKAVLPVDNVSTSTARLLSHSPDGSMLLAAGSGESARLFDAKTGELISVFGGFSQYITTARWSADGRYILLMSGDGFGRIFDSQARYLCTIDGREKTGNTFSDAVFANGGNTVYAATYAPLTSTYRWDISEYLINDTAFKTAYKKALEARVTDFKAGKYTELMALCEKYKGLARDESVKQEVLDAAEMELRELLSEKSEAVFWFNSAPAILSGKR